MLSTLIMLLQALTEWDDTQHSPACQSWCVWQVTRFWQLQLSLKTRDAFELLDRVGNFLLEFVTLARSAAAQLFFFFFMIWLKTCTCCDLSSADKVLQTVDCAADNHTEQTPPPAWYEKSIILLRTACYQQNHNTDIWTLVPNTSHIITWRK